MPKSSLSVSLKGADDIFSTEESRQEQHSYFTCVIAIDYGVAVLSLSYNAAE